ncbi:MAG: nitrite reductase small subunit NirD [Pseudomonadales bacterium]
MSIATSICKVSDLVPNTGACALVAGQQVALFRVTEAEGDKFYAISNYDPFSKANVLSRGIVGSTKGRVMVASPIYKQRFDLATGQCLDDESIFLQSWNVHIENDCVYVESQARPAAA